MTYDYLMDPSGGHSIYRNPMADWGMIGLDMGLALFGKWTVKKIGGMHMTAVDESKGPGLVGIATKRELIAKFGATPGQRFMASTLGRPAGQPGALGAAKTRALWSKAAEAKVKELKKYYKGFGKYIKGLGIATAALSLVDIGFSVMMEAAKPGVSREVLEEDRKRVFSNEGMLDTRIAYTMRQRSLQAIHDSQISIGRSLIGTEASYLHS